MARIEDSEKRKMEISSESAANDLAGSRLESGLRESLAMEVEVERSAGHLGEVQRFCGHVEEVEKVTSLLLCLAGRLARMEGEEGGLAEDKRGKLLEQLEEAKALKRRIDQRGEVVGRGLGERLGEERLGEYWAFLRSKERLVIERREVEERLRLSREQLRALL